MHAATLMLIILSAGLVSQWIAWRIHLPAIVVLIADFRCTGRAFCCRTELAGRLGTGRYSGGHRSDRNPAFATSGPPQRGVGFTLEMGGNRQ